MAEERNERFEKGVFFMTMSSVMLSFFTLFAKFGTQNISYFLLTFLRFGIPLLLLFPYLLTKCSARSLFNTSNLKIQILRSGCILLYQYSIFYYLMRNSLLNTTVLQNSAPLLIPILERLFFKHPIRMRTVISIIVSFFGVLCILQPDREIWETMSIAALLAPLGQAGSQVLYSHQAKKENQNVNLFYLFFLSTLFSGVVFLIGQGASLESAGRLICTPMMLLNILALGIVSIFNQSFRGLAYQHGKASTLAPFLYFSLIFSALLDWLIFGRLPNAFSIIGAVLVMLGGIIQIYRVRRP